MGMSNNQKITNRYLKKSRLLAYVLQMVPFVRCVILNGSLSQGLARESSDIDILIIARDGRIFTVRFLVNLLALTTFQKRPKDETKNHAGKFCFNFFLTVSYLKIATYRDEKRNKYCALNYNRSVLVWGDRGVFRRFFQQNKALFLSCHPRAGAAMARGSTNRGSNDSQSREKGHFPIGSTPFLPLGGLIEAVLGGWLGDRLEQLLKRIQIKRIESDPRTKKYPELIVYNDREMRFHSPRSRQTN